MIIFLNGASSSGKTSLARALQEAWDGPLIYWSLDHVISQLPFSYTGEGEYSKEGFELVSTAIVAREHGYALNDLSAAYIGQISGLGYDIVVDYVLLEETMLRPFVDNFREIEVCFVGIDCQEDVIARRNEARKDRAPGLSVPQRQSVHFCRSLYDLELDSTEKSPQALAHILLNHIGSVPTTKGLA